MKHKLLNKLWLRGLMLVALMCTTFTGAWAETYSLTPNQASTGSNATSYITTAMEFTYEGISWKMNQWNPKTLQVKTNLTSAASEFNFHNTSAFPGKITKVVITFSALTVSDSGKLLFKGGTSEVTATGSGTAGTWDSNTKTLTWIPEASADFTYFAFYQNGKAASGTNSLASEDAIVVTYEVSSTPTYALTITEPTGGTITVLDENGDEVSSGDEFEENAELTINAEASTGYTFSTWTTTAGIFGDAATTADNTFTMPAEEATIGATFTKNSYELTLTNDNGSLAVTVDGEEWDGSSKIPYNAEVEITATPNDGYLFGEWSSTDIGDYDEVTNPLTFNMPASDVEIAASFVDAASYYSITVDDNVTGGTISADKASAAEDAIITLTATPSTGYTFTSWTVKDAGDNTITVTDNQFTMPASNVTVTATFTAIAVTGVTLNKTSTSISVGETETLTATVAPANALNKEITWTSSNTSVATVSEGVVTAVAAGSATITVTTTDGNFTATCAVTVVTAVTFDPANDKGSTTGNNSADEMTKSGVTISSTDAAFRQTEYRLYSGSNTTFSVANGKITRIELTVNGSYKLSNLSTTIGTYNSSTGVWTGAATSVAFSASAQVRLDKIKVYYATTAAPTFSVAEGTYDAAQSVTISCATDGATIYYTTNGDTPTSSSTAYSSAISITETTTLKAIAIKDGVESDVASATYTMNRPTAPTFDVATSVFDEAFDLHLSAADGTTIYYTTDGTTPTTSSSVYSEEIAISTTTTVQAIAVKNGLTSDVASATYTYDSRTTPTFSLSTTSLGLKVNDTSDAVTLTTNSDGDVTFSCDDAHVTLTGTGKSRTISANAAGTYTVNVTVTNSDDYKDAAGTITVNVTKKATTMVIATAFDDGMDLYTASEGLIEGTVKYNDVALDPQPTITYSSSAETVATVDVDGTITFKKAGSTTLTASYAGNDEYEACQATYNLDLVDTTPQETEVSLSFNNTFFGISAITSWKTGDPTSATGELNNVSVTYAKGSSSYFYCNASQIRCYSGNSLSFTAPTGYYITSIEFTSSTWYAATPSVGAMNGNNSKLWEGNSDMVTFSWSSTARIESATITLAETVTVGGAGYTTYVAKHDISFPYGVTAYISTTKTSETLTLTEKASVPEGTAVILKGAAGTYALPTIKTTPESVTGNLLQASDGTVTGGEGIYALAKKNEVVGFYPVDSNVTIPAGKAYLEIDDNSEVKGFTFVFDDDADGIQTLSDSSLKGENIYNLAGQRIQKMQKGINIVNGKKILK